jgi:hypothetical protein
MIKRESPEVQVRPEGRGDGQLISDRSIGSNVQRPIGDIGGSGIDKLELRPLYCLQLLDGGFLEKALWLGPSKGESRIVPAECQVEVGLKGLAALGSSGQICEEKSGRDLERQLARRQPGFICRYRAAERQENSGAIEEQGSAILRAARRLADHRWLLNRRIVGPGSGAESDHSHARRVKNRLGCQTRLFQARWRTSWRGGANLQRECAFSFERAPKMPKKKRNFLKASAANRSDQTGPV